MQGTLNHLTMPSVNTNQRLKQYSNIISLRPWIINLAQFLRSNMFIESTFRDSNQTTSAKWGPAQDTTWNWPPIVVLCRGFGSELENPIRFLVTHVYWFVYHFKKSLKRREFPMKLMKASFFSREIK